MEQMTLDNLEIQEEKNRVSEKDKLKEIKKRLEELRKKEAYHSELYYEKNTNEISDYEYDMLKKEIEKIEEQYPELKDENGVSKRIGAGKISTLFEKVVHNVPLQSLQDVFNYEEIYDFEKRVKKVLEQYEEPTYVVETKIDGLSVAIEYNEGKIVKAATRGDGKIGEDVTENVLQIKSLPHEIPYNGKIIIRGEIFMPYSVLEEINQKAVEEGKKIFANTRNAASGTLRQKKKEVVKERKLDIFVFNVQESDETFETHKQSLEFVAKQGIQINPYIFQVKDMNEAISKIEKIGEMREDLPFAIDGAVIKVNELSLRKEIGEIEKYPKWAVAYKYPPQKVETVIDRVDLSVGRTGSITPIAIFKEGKVVDGSRIYKATLNNFEIIQKKGIRIKDHVLIQKAGDVIPEVVEVLTEKRNGNEIVIEVPTKCPECNTGVNYDNVTPRCTNLDCPAKLEQKIIYFVSKTAMNIEGMGEKIIIDLINMGKIKDIADIYTITKEDITKLKELRKARKRLESGIEIEEEEVDYKKNVKESKKLEENIIKAIEKSKSNPFTKVLISLGIPGVGPSQAKEIAKYFNNIENIEKASKEELKEIKGVGEIVANNVTEYMSQKGHIEILERLKAYGLQMKYDEAKAEEEEEAKIDESEIVSEKLKGEIIVITGKMTKPKKEIYKEIYIHSGEVKEAINKEVTMVIYDKPGSSKYKKAENLGIKLLTEEEFYQTIN